LDFAGLIYREIKIREDAPPALREYIIQTLYALGLSPKQIRPTICQVLRVSPDDSNWTEFPNIDMEIRGLIANCDWYKVYDIVEALSRKFTFIQTDFNAEINDFFLTNGIGWKLEDGKIIFRGDGQFEKVLKDAKATISQKGFDTAKHEITEAINNLSKKPIPDATGAVQHSLACLECVAREIVGNRKLTLGELIRQNRGVVPPPLDVVIEKIWGFSSEQGRHLREGGAPDLDEVELLVGLSLSLSAYLAKKKI
jgi:hypothetical protein